MVDALLDTDLILQGFGIEQIAHLHARIIIGQLVEDIVNDRCLGFAGFEIRAVFPDCRHKVSQHL